MALFRHAMVVLETLFLGNDSGSLVNAAQSLPAWRRLITPALGGLTAGALLWLWQRRSIARPHAATDYMEALETGDGCFDTPASLGEIAGVIAGRGHRQRNWPRRRHDPAGRAGSVAVRPPLHAAD